MTDLPSQFPRDFVFGAATAAYQIEGAVAADGRSPSVWDTFTHQPGRVFENQNGDVACDHYHRWREDVALMHDLGLQAYRFSFAWSRLLPDGVGQPNAKGIDFYDRLIDRLLEAGIAPWVTLYHWDLPEALQRRGGFLNRDLVEWFGEYAGLAAHHFGDRVRHWITFNEPTIIMGFGYQEGLFAPGLKLPYSDCLLGAHHLLLAHGRGVQALRAGCGGPVKISIAQTSRELIPTTETPENIQAARRAYFGSTQRTMWNLAWWMDPILFGQYPADGVEAFGKDMPPVASDDLGLISQQIDFLAYNCYTGWSVQAGTDGKAEMLPERWGLGNARGTLPWLNVTPRAPYWAARFQTERYGLPLVFSENGFCNVDFVHLDGKVHDLQRIDFLTRYLREIGRAIGEGIPISAYFYWSIMDNFEWAEGFKERFGLVHVDYTTQCRTPKDSFYWYQELIRKCRDRTLADKQAKL